MSGYKGQHRINFLTKLEKAFANASSGKRPDIQRGVTAALEAERRLGKEYSLGAITGFKDKQIRNPDTRRCTGHQGAYRAAFQLLAHKTRDDMVSTQANMWANAFGRELQVIDAAQDGTTRAIELAVAALERLDAGFGTNGFLMLEQRTKLPAEYLRKPQASLDDNLNPNQIIIKTLADLHRELSRHDSTPTSQPLQCAPPAAGRVLPSPRHKVAAHLQRRHA